MEHSGQAMAELSRFKDLLAKVHNEYTDLLARNAALAEQHTLLYNMLGDPAGFAGLSGRLLSTPLRPGVKREKRETVHFPIGPRSMRSSQFALDVSGTGDLSGGSDGLLDDIPLGEHEACHLSDDNVSDHSPTVATERVTGNDKDDDADAVNQIALEIPSQPLWQSMGQPSQAVRTSVVSTVSSTCLGEQSMHLEEGAGAFSALFDAEKHRESLLNRISSKDTLYRNSSKDTVNRNSSSPSLFSSSYYRPSTERPPMISEASERSERSCGSTRRTGESPLSPKSMLTSIPEPHVSRPQTPQWSRQESASASLQGTASDRESHTSGLGVRGTSMRSIESSRPMKAQGSAQSSIAQRQGTAGSLATSLVSPDRGFMKNTASCKSIGSHPSFVMQESSLSLDLGHVGLEIEDMFPLWWNPKRDLIREIQARQASDRESQLKNSINRSHSFASVEPVSTFRGGLVVSPIGVTRLMWDVVVFMLILFDAWVTPFDIIFCAQDLIPGTMGLIRRWGLPIFFSMDIILNFNTGYISERQMVSNRRMIAAQYMKFWFWIDLVATFPFDYWFRAGNCVRLLRLLKVVKSMQTIRSFTILTYTKSWQRMDNYYVNALRPLSLLKSLFGAFVCLTMLVLVHLHCCAWALLQPDTGGATSMAGALKDYLDSYWAVYLAVMNGEPLSASTAPMQFFAMLIATEKAVLMVAAVTWAVFETLMQQGDTARSHLLHKQTLKYMQRHGLPLKMQTQVLQGLIEAGSAKAMQKDFINLMESDLPKELQRKIARELWGAKLLTLGLLQLVSEWNDDFITNLALACREDVLASNAILFSEGDASFSAYYIITGEMQVFRPVTEAFGDDDDFIGSMAVKMEKMSNFTAGMWLGESALVSPSFRRGLQAISESLVSLMIVPADYFHKLLRDAQLSHDFERWVTEELWRGLCGRCGRLGDHFSDTCPVVYGGSGSSAVKARNSGRPRLSIQNTVDRMFTQGFASSTPKELDTVDETKAITRELREFLRQCDGEHLLSHLEFMGIVDLSDLEQLDMTWFRKELLKQEPPVILSPRDMAVLSSKQVMKFREGVNQGMSRMMRRQSKGNYLVFLSHYKLEAGTEAALMRTELEKLILEESEDFDADFNTPVFLDSEDLTNLKELQVEVVRSHNLVVLLTTGVLSRPWCLVEMVTAVQHGIPVVLVQVTKPGSQFVFPDDQFFNDLVAGKILDEGAMSIIQSAGMNMSDLESTLREIFKSIAVPYSPHKPVHVRQAELKTLMRHCKLRGEDTKRLECSVYSTKSGKLLPPSMTERSQLNLSNQSNNSARSSPR